MFPRCTRPSVSSLEPAVPLRLAPTALGQARRVPAWVSRRLEATNWPSDIDFAIARCALLLQGTSRQSSAAVRALSSAANTGEKSPSAQSGLRALAHAALLLCLEPLARRLLPHRCWMEAAAPCSSTWPACRLLFSKTLRPHDREAFPSALDFGSHRRRCPRASRANHRPCENHRH